MSADAGHPPVEIKDTDAGWGSMLEEWARFQWARFHRGSEPPGTWPPRWALPVLIIAGLATVVVLLAGLIIPLIRAGLRFLTSAVDGGADWVRDWGMARVVLDPVRSWLTAHSAGLPVDVDALWWTWATAGIVLFLLGFLFAAIGARIGWVGYGAATVAMVYTTTSGPARPTAAAITVLWWVLLSVFALRPRAAVLVPPGLVAHLSRRLGA